MSDITGYRKNNEFIINNILKKLIEFWLNEKKKRKKEKWLANGNAEFKIKIFL